MNLHYTGNPFVPMPTVQVQKTSNQPVKKYYKPALLTSEEAADYLSLKKNTLVYWRCTKSQQVPYIKVGGRVRYQQKDLDKWLEKQRIAPEGFDDE